MFTLREDIVRSEEKQRREWTHSPHFRSAYAIPAITRSPRASTTSRLPTVPLFAQFSNLNISILRNVKFGRRCGSTHRTEQLVGEEQTQRLIHAPQKVRAYIKRKQYGSEEVKVSQEFDHVRPVFSPYYEKLWSLEYP